jgi:voltage-gated potassium channel
MLQILIGLSMIGLTVAIHAIGCARWLGFVGRQHEKRKPRHPTTHLFWDLLSTAMVLLVLVVVESLLWALLYSVLPSYAGLSSFGEAAYFSMVTLTTLGYGDVVLAPEWRILGPMEAMAGVTVIGLTTALLFAVVQRGWQVIHGDRA